MKKGPMVDAEELGPETAPGVIFDQFIATGRLGYQRCPHCSKAVFPARVLCTDCGSGKLLWEASKGRGTVYSLSRIEPRDAEPYTIALIDLDEGFRMMSHVSCSDRDPVIGDPVTLAFALLGDAEQPVFEVDTVSNAREN